MTLCDLCSAINKSKRISKDNVRVTGINTQDINYFPRFYYTTAGQRKYVGHIINSRYCITTDDRCRM